MIIADAHVGERHGDSARMAAVVHSLPKRQLGELIVLGDAFHYLIGMSKYWSPSIRTVLDAWKAARDAGVRIVFIEGNRDFFLDTKELAPFVDWVGCRYEFAAGQRRFLVTHGDRVNQRDLAYRFWRVVSKSLLVRTMARTLPGPIANSMFAGMEARIRQTNARYRAHLPERALQRYAEEAWSSGIDVVLWGHFHSGWRIHSAEQLAMVVPAWLDANAAMTVEPDGAWSINVEEGA
jgi:UDP-2,3-diacylglucosamine hydrolase